MKSEEMNKITKEGGRAPQGARGLKFLFAVNSRVLKIVAPRKGRVG